MSTRDTILSILRVLRPELVAKYRVRSLALFGSYARGDQTDVSDIDVLVDVDPAIGLGFVELGDYLEAKLGRPVDLVSADAVKPRYRREIEKDLLYV
ncbi:MAG: nucleotidyltransferase family protein [Lentisphaeria bacterium]